MGKVQKMPASLLRALGEMGFLSEGEPLAAEPLTGGVASDIWRVQLPDRMVCAKQALPQLKVTQLWQVPVERNAYEVAWFQTVSEIVPTAVPDILGHDPDLGVFVMEYLNPQQYQLWKNQLRDGVVEVETARRVAGVLAAIHAGTAGRQEIAERFPTDELFFALRPEPYLLATANKHPDLASALNALAETTMSNRKALVHGDVSPKNIMVGEAGPVFLDAECAWYGDPAFDLAFCLNHLLLKCLWKKQHSIQYLHCFERMVADYLAAVNWEESADLEYRVARLLPGLMLARVDGKSPVEYVVTEPERNCVRDFARRFLVQPSSQLQEISSAWRLHIAGQKQEFS
jgi:aminoglycoside phosphotransferase (APT) family kinase protein